jgi:EAL domain-containing protein (putative c-di-GMP-specific phosphodiesterase class I)
MIELENPGQRPMRPTVDHDGERQTVWYGDYTVYSAFQPILSVSHMRAVGYQALLLAQEKEGGAVSPQAVFSHAARLGDLLELGRLMQSLHLNNFRGLKARHEWLFLNLHPASFADLSYAEALLAELKKLGLRAQRVVLEVPEQPPGEPKRFLEAIEFFRRHGFLIALDHFGAKHSNIDRVWQLQPDIVKIDQRIMAQAATQQHVARVLPDLVSVLHETGRLVLVGGVENEREALVAMECNADFVQGSFFAPASVSAVDAPAAARVIDGLMNTLRRRVAERDAQRAAQLAPYVLAMIAAADAIAAGQGAPEATRELLMLPEAARCFLLDGDGRQIGDNVFALRRSSRRSNRFMPLLHSEGARWERRPYFQNAIQAPGRVHVTRPYLSINEAHLCVTLSTARETADGTLVLCADIDWERQRP